MSKKIRLAAICAAALLALALVFSTFFVIAEADHHCSGWHCAICHQIQACQKLLKQVSAGHKSVAQKSLLCLFMLLLPLGIRDILPVSSPVLWRVKLLN